MITPTLDKQNFFAANGSQVSGSPAGNTLLFTGRRFDLETSLGNYRTRYLDPASAKFITRDTIGVWGDGHNQGNGVAYLYHNSQTQADPFGNSWKDKVKDYGIDFTLCLFKKFEFKMAIDFNQALLRDYQRKESEADKANTATDECLNEHITKTLEREKDPLHDAKTRFEEAIEMLRKQYPAASAISECLKETFSPLP